MMMLSDVYILDSHKFGIGEIILKGGKIIDVQLSPAKELKPDRPLVIPGFWNLHTHLGTTILRNRGENKNSYEWSKEIIWPLESELIRDRKLLEISVLIGVYESILNGVVGINDLYITNYIDILEETPIKGMFSLSAISVPSIEVNVEDVLNVRGSRIRSGCGVYSLCATPYEWIKELAKISVEENKIFHIHISETRSEVYQVLSKFGKRPVELLHDILEKNCILASASYLTVREIKAVGTAGSTVVHNPSSNLKLGTGGIMQWEELWEYGANVTLGTDSAVSNNRLDMWKEMHLASLLQKHLYWDVNRGDVRKIFKAATENGARALGFNSGIISPGAEADFVVVLPSPGFVGDPYAAVVHSLSSSSIVEVFIDGKPRKEEARQKLFKLCKKLSNMI